MFFSVPSLLVCLGRLGRTEKSASRPAFTLIELLVVVVILTVLASLSLAGLAGARQRAKIDKTKSTIRKIDAVIRPMYDSYRTRRVTNNNDDGSSPVTGTIAVTNRLRNIRRLSQYEMPDTWGDVMTNSALPAAAQTGATRSYFNYKQALTMRTDDYASAECLFMIVARSGFEPEALELFRADEIGDIDLASNGTTRGDGAFEFWDGWGRPIAFKRWAPGWVSDTIPPDSTIPTSLTNPPRTLSPIQIADKKNSHDPMDPMRIDPAAYALVPLIYSPGPDEATNDPDNGATSGYGLENVAVDIMATCNVVSGVLNGTPKAGEAYRDNITNHDLSKK
jgi:prepilin-type N-terminal cleavage/methylation domain-containing protein